MCEGEFLWSCFPQSREVKVVIIFVEVNGSKKVTCCWFLENSFRTKAGPEKQCGDSKEKAPTFCQTLCPQALQGLS